MLNNMNTLKLSSNFNKILIEYTCLITFLINFFKRKTLKDLSLGNINKYKFSRNQSIIK